MAVIYSCGNGGKGSNEQNADSLATAEQVGKKNTEQVEPQITLTVKQEEMIGLHLAADEDNIQVKIVNGNRDTSFTIGTKETHIEIRAIGTQLSVFGKVTKFGCSYNWDIKNVTALDVSQNTYLTSLNCSANELSKLDLSKNTALQSLSCGWNQLTNLDVSNNTSLIVLNCQHNELSSLDLTNNTYLQELECCNNKLTSLNIDKQTVLTYLNCSENQLSTLDVSKNTELKRFACFSNKLTSLDVSKNKNLEYLNTGELKVDISNNPLLK